ncbi:MAG: HAMP domain-containing protein, partial [Planctomycetota bacterium]
MPAQESDRWRPSLRLTMLALIALPTLIIYLLLLGGLLSYMRGMNRAEVEQAMTMRASDHAARFDAAFREVAAIARMTSTFLETNPDLTEAQIYAQLEANVVMHPLVYGSAMAFEPGTFREDDSLFCPYVCRDGDGIRSMNISRDVLDWYADPQWEWWHLPKASGEATWTNPYFDDGAGDALMVTFASPFFVDGTVRGVATVDVLVSAIREQVAEDIETGLRFVIFNREGQFVYSPQDAEVMSQTIYALAESVGRPDIGDACRPIASGAVGTTVLPGWEGDPPPDWEEWAEPQWVSYAPIASTNWSLAILLPEREAMAAVYERMSIASAVLGGTLILIIGGIWFVSGVLTRPVARLTHGVRSIAGGDLQTSVSARGPREFAALATDVNAMARDLQGYTERLASQRASGREAMIIAMAKLAESRDDDTGKHLERICRYVEVLANEIVKDDDELDEAWVHTITATAALHDIGKVGIPDAVLKKPGRLTDDERRAP